MDSIFLTIKDFQIIEGCHYETARRRRIACLDALGKKGNKITVWEYCELEDIADKQEFWKYLQAKRKGGEFLLAS